MKPPWPREVVELLACSDKKLQGERSSTQKRFVVCKGRVGLKKAVCNFNVIGCSWLVVSFSKGNSSWVVTVMMMMVVGRCRLHLLSLRRSKWRRLYLILQEQFPLFLHWIEG